jgi:hypothetical protein
LKKENGKNGFRLLGGRQIKRYQVYDGHSCPSSVLTDKNVRRTVRNHLPLALTGNAERVPPQKQNPGFECRFAIGQLKARPNAGVCGFPENFDFPGSANLPN